MKKYHVTRLLLLLGVIFSGGVLIVNQGSAVKAAAVGQGVSAVTTEPIVTATTVYTVTTYMGVPSATGRSPYNGLGEYTIDFNGDSIHLLDFTVGGTTYLPAEFANKVEFQRSGAGNASDLFWAQRSSFTSDGAGGGTLVIQSSLPTNVEQVISDDILNRGMDNLFANTGSNNNNDIERADFIFSTGLTPTLSNLSTHGFLILDRGGNDAFKIAAITALDVNNDPSDYLTLQSVPATQWASAANLLAVESTVFRNDTYTTAFTPMEDVVLQNLKGIFVTFGELGLTAGQPFYGFSLFPDDVPESTSTADLVTLPPTVALNTTDNTTGGLDLVGGTATVYSPCGCPTAVTMEQIGIQDAPLVSVQSLLAAVFLLCLSSLYVLQRRAVLAEMEEVRRK